MPEIINVKEAAKRLGKTKDEIIEMINTGQIPSAKWTGMYYEIDYEGIKHLETKKLAATGDKLLEVLEDDFGSLEYFMKEKEKNLARGYEDSALLDSYCMQLTLMRKINIQYYRVFDDEKKKVELMKQMTSTNSQVITLRKSLEADLNKGEKEEEITTLHKQMVEKAKRFIREHMGEYSLLCSGCGTVVNTEGLPHWATYMEDKDGERYYYVFSPEMWYALKMKLLDPHLIAFFLRTSIEGVTYTANERGEPDLDKFDIKEEEKKLAELQKAYEGTKFQS